MQPNFDSVKVNVPIHADGTDVHVFLDGLIGMSDLVGAGVFGIMSAMGPILPLPSTNLSYDYGL
ncbi:hypothetical protein BDZ89DRAFT_1139544 [Hymenopellis radicata]|nr:hypothetical protein BDZ89DRAFT_1139544 [Hymenopellis radicata]